jgi:hypothetical protein
LQQIAGHSSILISQRYVHPTPERLEDAFARLEVYNREKINGTPKLVAGSVRLGTPHKSPHNEKSPAFQSGLSPL